MTMANDADKTKTLNSANSTGNSAALNVNQNVDQQKIPPLRIVLNTSSNPKHNCQNENIENEDDSSRTSFIKQEQDIPQKEFKTARARFKLGTGKRAKTSQAANSIDQDQQSSDFFAENNQFKNEPTEIKTENTSSASNYASLNHLRRITRRSQRSAMTEQEEVIDIFSINTEESQDAFFQNNDYATDKDKNNETKTKKRKGDTPEGQSENTESNDQLNFHNPKTYAVPMHNSFELYRNIRKQIDSKLRSLNSIIPQAPHGFKSYLLNRGAYLLDGNKLGNGFNDVRCTKVYGPKFCMKNYLKEEYLFPNQTRVPGSLSGSTSLTVLFLEQETQRHKMRLQHIKEREKLTLAAEQEIIRVYNQAAMNAVNQDEPFSACTMLKMQEIYNYLEPEDCSSRKNNSNSQKEDEKEQNFERKKFFKNMFLSRLQEVDDKWEKVRCEMLTRHKNEAESLNAMQKLEWEWKTKEIGACDIRTNLVVDDCFVPKIAITIQDY